VNNNLNIPINALYRSRIEIYRILKELTGESCPIFAEVGEERLFVTRILLVNENSGYLVIEYGADKSINSSLFNRPSLKFRASYSGAHLVFKVSKPLDILLNDKPAIRFALPRSLIYSQRRELSRAIIPPHISLSYTAKDVNGKLFDAKIFDISMDGMGGMICDESVTLQVGTVLKESRIVYSGGKPVTVDLVVRNTKIITRSDGTRYTRTGVRFMQRPEEIQALINLFVYDLDGKV
jgi:c-di-GMP-binding flagellar brake protein YcgR